MTGEQTPYLCHVFVCTNDRRGARKSCGDEGAGEALRQRLKAEVEARGWKPRVRVSGSGCLGRCARGPNIMLYPQGLWFAGVSADDLAAVLEAIGQILA